MEDWKPRLVSKSDTWQSLTQENERVKLIQKEKENGHSNNYERHDCVGIKKIQWKMEISLLKMWRLI